MTYTQNYMPTMNLRSSSLCICYICICGIDLLWDFGKHFHTWLIVISSLEILGFSQFVWYVYCM